MVKFCWAQGYHGFYTRVLLDFTFSALTGSCFPSLTIYPITILTTLKKPQRVLLAKMQNNSCTFLPQLKLQQQLYLPNASATMLCRSMIKNNIIHPNVLEAGFVHPSNSMKLSCRTNPNSFLMKQSGFILCPARVSLCFLQWWWLIFPFCLSLQGRQPLQWHRSLWEGSAMGSGTRFRCSTTIR